MFVLLNKAKITNGSAVVNVLSNYILYFNSPNLEQEVKALHTNCTNQYMFKNILQLYICLLNYNHYFMMAIFFSKLMAFTTSAKNLHSVA